jgi:hypothetical protein
VTPSGCVPKDLSAQNVSPAAGSSFASASPITFTGQANNVSADSISEGGWADLEIDWNSDGSYTNYNAYGGSQLGSFAVGQSKTLSYTLAGASATSGSHRYRFRVDTINSLVESDESNNVSSWVGFTVADAPTVNLDATGCNIPVGGTQCSGQVTWSFSNVLAPENYQVRNTTTGISLGTSATGNAVAVVLPYGVHRVAATANGVSDSKEVIARCAPPSAWNSTISQCEIPVAPPSLSITGNPVLVRSGQSSSLVVTIDSNLLLDCTLYGASSGTVTFVHDGLLNQVKTYTYATKVLTSALNAELRCVSSTGLSATAHARIEVVPTIEEI